MEIVVEVLLALLTPLELLELLVLLLIVERGQMKLFRPQQGDL
jgi:hypothetical protein